jgi:hypothetical protein
MALSLSRVQCLDSRHGQKVIDEIIDLVSTQLINESTVLTLAEISAKKSIDACVSPVSMFCRVNMTFVVVHQRQSEKDIVIEYSTVSCTGNNDRSMYVYLRVVPMKRFEAMSNSCVV